MACQVENDRVPLRKTSDETIKGLAAKKDRDSAESTILKDDHQSSRLESLSGTFMPVASQSNGLSSAHGQEEPPGHQTSRKTFVQKPTVALLDAPSLGNPKDSGKTVVSMQHPVAEMPTPNQDRIANANPGNSIS